MLELKEIAFGYSSGNPVLHDLSLSVQAGEFVAIAGRNGSGKTTVTRLMTALKKPSQGSILFNGVDATQATTADMARHIGYVFQNPDRQMFRDTVEHEVAFGPEQLGFGMQEKQAAVDDALQRTGLQGLAAAYPMTLSKGQKQRVAIASALAMKPKILILDEPTSGQDCRERERLLQLLGELNRQGMTIILVTHDMEIVARYARRVIVMAGGRVAFDGIPNQLFAGTHPLGEWGLTSTTTAISREILPNNLQVSVDTERSLKSTSTAPLTKLLFTVAVSIWSLLLVTVTALTVLVAVQLLLLTLAGQLGRTSKAVGALTLFAAMLTGLQYAFGSSMEVSVATGLRMISMTLVFLLLLATTSMQHLTAALVSQCRVPYEYAFMFTAALRFVPDFLGESKAVREAQACRGYQAKGNVIARLIAYVALVEPLVLRAVSRSETMALSLALRGFGSKSRSFSANVALGSRDYSLLAGMGAITVVLVGMRMS